MSFAVRRMQAADLDPVVALAAHAAEAPQWTRSDYEQLLPPATPGLLLAAPWVALVEDCVAGFAVARWLRGEPAAEIENLVVDGKHRRQGIGTALIKACAEWALQAGASALRLEVRASNQAAIALYRTVGFAAAGVRPAYYTSPPEEALLLRVELH